MGDVYKSSKEMKFKKREPSCSLNFILVTGGTEVVRVLLLNQWQKL